MNKQTLILNLVLENYQTYEQKKPARDITENIVKNWQEKLKTIPAERIEEMFNIIKFSKKNTTMITPQEILNEWRKVDHQKAQSICICSPCQMFSVFSEQYCFWHRKFKNSNDFYKFKIFLENEKYNIGMVPENAHWFLSEEDLWETIQGKITASEFLILCSDKHNEIQNKIKSIGNLFDYRRIVWAHTPEKLQKFEKSWKKQKTKDENIYQAVIDSYKVPEIQPDIRDLPF